MIGLFFEVTPRPGHEQAYFDIAAGLRSELDKNPGLMFIDRFKSLARQNLVLSHSHWRDEASLAKWRSHGKHHAAQLAGRGQHFEDYRLRIGELVCEWLPQPGELRRSAQGSSYNDPALRAERYLIASTANQPPQPADGDEVLASVYRESEYIMLTPAASLPNGLATVQRMTQTGALTSVRMYLISRDYGLYDRMEAPQYYPPVDRHR